MALRLYRGGPATSTCVSHETVRRVLKKTDQAVEAGRVGDPTATQRHFAAAMEKVLTPSLRGLLMDEAS